MPELPQIKTTLRLHHYVDGGIDGTYGSRGGRDGCWNRRVRVHGNRELAAGKWKMLAAGRWKMGDRRCRLRRSTRHACRHRSLVVGAGKSGVIGKQAQLNSF